MIPTESLGVQVKDKLEYVAIEDISCLVRNEDEIDGKEDTRNPQAAADRDSSESARFPESPEGKKIGVDVSSKQGEIHWSDVKSAGVDFGIVRVGYRGSNTGELIRDPNFERNWKEMKAAGMPGGISFFSQAINEEEAVEEAEFCLQQLESVGLTPDNMEMPVVYDPESILDAEARTDNVTGEQFTANSVAFCERIKEEGYETMIYANMKWEAFLLDLSKLSDYPFWYADYEEQPQTPYDFSMWQYSNTASVPGVSGECDVDVQLIPIRK